MSAPERRATGQHYGSDLGFTEGPVALADGRVLFTSLTGTIFSFNNGTIEASVDTGCGPTGLATDASGTVYMAACSGIWGAPSATPAGILRLRDGKAEPVVTEGLDAPNDLAFGPDGRLYFTDPVSQDALTQAVPGRVCASKLEDASVDVLHEGGLFPNGLAFDSTGEILYVAESFAERIVRYELANGSLGAPEILCEIADGQPDGMALDIEGNLWQCVNASDSVEVFGPSGKLIERLKCGEGSYPSNGCFGGPDGSTLFVTAAGTGGLASFDVGVRGLALYPFR